MGTTSHSYGPIISGNGGFVVYSSKSSNFYNGDNNDGYDIFVRDLTQKKTELISIGLNGEIGNSRSGSSDNESVAISDDGRFVVFESNASNLVANTPDLYDGVFVRDRSTNVTKIVSVENDGNYTNIHTIGSVGISGDGNTIVFSARYRGGSLGGDGNPNNLKVFIHDRLSNSTELLANQGDSPKLSFDGRYVTFDNGAIYLYDRVLETLQKVSDVPHPSLNIAGGRGRPNISGDGQYLVFDTIENTLETDIPDQDDLPDVFLYAR